MKPQGILLVALLLVPLLSCEEDVPLGEALSDVRSAAPTVCKDYCAWAQQCVWNSYDFVVTGIELEAAKQDWQQACVVTCANRAGKGVFVYRADWNEQDEQYTFNFTEKLGGKIWSAYFKCLWDNTEAHGFWICGEYGGPELEIADEAACATFATCIEILDIGLLYEWNPNAGENGDCHPQGFDALWDGWSYIW